MVVSCKINLLVSSYGAPLHVYLYSLICWFLQDPCTNCTRVLTGSRFSEVHSFLLLVFLPFCTDLSSALQKRIILHANVIETDIYRMTTPPTRMSERAPMHILKSLRVQT